MENKERIITSQEIQVKVSQIADELNKKYSESQKPLVVIAIMNGAISFAKDLMEQLHFPIIFETIFTQSYSASQYTSFMTVSDQLKRFTEGKDLSEYTFIIVDDICDSGKTLNRVSRELIALRTIQSHQPMKIDECALLIRKGMEQRVDHYGFSIAEGEWAIGYGMDDENGLNRNLSHIILTNKNLVHA